MTDYQRDAFLFVNLHMWWISSHWGETISEEINQSFQLDTLERLSPDFIVDVDDEENALSGVSTRFAMLYPIAALWLLNALVVCGSPPIVLWHGMGDSCCNPLSLGSLIKLIKRQLPDPYVVSLRIGSNLVEDTSNGFFMNANHQIDYACRLINADEKLSQGYHAVG